MGYRYGYDHTVAYLVAALVFVVVLIVGIGWANNLGSGNQAKS